MVRKFHARENYDDYDTNPYKGGYDINAAYGDVQAADEECAYPRTEYEEDDEPQDVQYGNESNPYRRGPPGPSIYGGRPQPGAVYGGGRDRTRPSYDEAQPDDGVQTGYSRRKPAYGGGEQSGYGLDEDDSGYRNPRPGYGYGDEEESSGYRNPRPSYGYGDEEESSGYRNPRPSYGYGNEEESSGYRNPSQAYGQQDSSGYGNPTYGYGTEESGYRKPRPAYDDEETGQSGYRNPSYGYGEQETGGGYGYGRTRYSRDEESSQARSGYGQTTYGEQEGGYGDSGGGYGGGSAYTEQPPQQEAPARRSWW